MAGGPGSEVGTLRAACWEGLYWPQYLLVTRGMLVLSPLSRFAPGGIRKGAAGYDVTFIHPKGNHVSPVGGSGVLVELVQAPPEVVAHYDEVKAKYEDK